VRTIQSPHWAKLLPSFRLASACVLAEGGSEERENFGWVKKFRLASACVLAEGGSERGEGKFWLGKKIPVGKRLCVYDFSLAGRNVIVVWTIYKVAIGQSTFVPVGKRCSA